jgi:magnesium chelatase family protein
LLPAENAREAAIHQALSVYGLQSLKETVDFLAGRQELLPLRVDAASMLAAGQAEEKLDFADVKGQAGVKRALEIAAAGGHNILLIGSPGSGKTMLARRLPSILPDLTLPEALQLTKIYSAAGMLPAETPLFCRRPFRAPHHSASQASLIGGGRVPSPGEVSLAHNGVLFLDEMPEFGRSLLEVLRQPLEDGFVTVTRVGGRMEFPARFQLVGAMNPCPCGYYGDTEKACSCTPQAVRRYQDRISGPLLDRIDLHVNVPRVRYQELSSAAAEESSAAVKARVEAARAMQRHRTPELSGNASLSHRQILDFCPLSPAGEKLMEHAFSRMGLSARAYDKILRVARSIADLAGQADIAPEHLAEAIQYRQLDRAPVY